MSYKIHETVNNRPHYINLQPNERITWPIVTVYDNTYSLDIYCVETLKEDARLPMLEKGNNRITGESWNEIISKRYEYVDKTNESFLIISFSSKKMKALKEDIKLLADPDPVLIKGFENDIGLYDIIAFKNPTARNFTYLKNYVNPVNKLDTGLKDQMEFMAFTQSLNQGICTLFEAAEYPEIYPFIHFEIVPQENAIEVLKGSKRCVLAAIPELKNFYQSTIHESLMIAQMQ